MGFLSKEGLRHLLTRITHADAIRVDSRKWNTVQDVVNSVENIQTTSSINDVAIKDGFVKLVDAEGHGVSNGIDMAEIRDSFTEHYREELKESVADAENDGLMSSQDKVDLDSLKKLKNNPTVSYQSDYIEGSWSYVSSLGLYRRRYPTTANLDWIKNNTIINLTLSKESLLKADGMLGVTETFNGYFYMYSTKDLPQRLDFDMEIIQK